MNKEYKQFHRLTRQFKNWPGRRTAIIVILLFLLITGTGIVLFVGQVKSRDSITPDSGTEVSLSEDQSGDNDIFGCYEFDECLYMNPLSSALAVKGFMPYVYGLGRDGMIIANTGTGDIEYLAAEYENSTIAESEFSSINNFFASSLPDLSRYEERRRRARFTGEGRKYGLYQMDDEIWLVMLSGGEIGVWSIYRLQPTDQFTFSDLEYALGIQSGAADNKTQMSLQDVYELARKGEDLQLSDLEPFLAEAAGAGFTIMRYDIQGGCVLIVHSDTPDSAINYARLSKRGYDPFDEALSVDIRDGAKVVAAYLNPLHSLEKLKIENAHGSTGERELIYEFDGYRYFLNTGRADHIFITFDNGDRLPLRQALEERRTTVEDLASNGLLNIFMEPADNPMGGSFPILHHLHKFTFEGEAFYPSTSFLYMEYPSAYFDITEISDILQLQGRKELAEKLRFIASTSNLPVIAGKAYLKEDGFAEAGIAVKIGWELSSHTPVSFTLENE